MNFIDILVVVVIALFAVIGFLKGFIPQLFQFAGIFCAFYFNTPVSRFISSAVSDEPEGVLLMLVQIAAFLFIFGVFFVAGMIISKTVDSVLTSLPNRIAGIIFGAVNGFFVVCLIFIIIRAFPAGDTFLKKYVTPDKFTDDIIDQSIELAGNDLSAQGLKNKANEAVKNAFTESKTDNVDSSAADTTETEATKIYSRLGYGAYRISMLMDPFVQNTKSVLSKKYEDVIEIKTQDKING
ncbi:MAG TPA: CvpA family protein [Clostridiales bacterium]|nr:CvpA family protein [Clostridiales bacterium]HQP69494.1 CvpA family protein [Clostridiales bacterium]